MRMRLLIAVLLAANGLYALWAMGGLALLGMVPASEAQREPQRIAQQLRPEALKIGAEAGPAAPPPAAGATTPAEPPASAPPGTD